MIFLFKQIVGPKNFCVQNNLVAKKLLAKQNVGPERILVQKFLIKKNFVWKNSLSETIGVDKRPKKSCGWKFFGPERILRSEIFDKKK